MYITLIILIALLVVALAIMGLWGINRNSDLKYRTEQLAATAQRVEIAEQNLREVTSHRDDLKNECSILATRLDGFAEREKLLTLSAKDQQEQLRQTFENIAGRILEEKTAKFTQSNREQVERLLEPLGKDIEGFRKKVEEVFLSETRERASLSTELKKLQEMNVRLSDEAQSLSRAIKGEHNPKMQGDWGEMILDTILSGSGLQEGVHYFTQENTTDDDGRRTRPDVIVRYPGEREIIIDSKVSLAAYSRYINSNDEDERSRALAEHIASVKRHVDSLSSKSYEEREASVDFVMMFMPIEASYLLALSNDPSLWEYAYKRKIVLSGPTHLITALKLVYDLWTRHEQSVNAKRIADQSAKMYDKFVGFVLDMQALGKSLSTAEKAYDAAMNKLTIGKGNLVRRAEELKKLGVRAAKSMPKLSAGKDEEEDEEEPDIDTELVENSDENISEQEE